MFMPLSFKKNPWLAPFPGEYNDCVFEKFLGVSQEGINKLTEEKVLY